MIGIWSCCLHIFHVSYKTGIEGVDREVKKLLIRNYKFLHDSPVEQITPTLQIVLNFHFPSVVQDELETNP